MSRSTWVEHSSELHTQDRYLGVWTYLPVFWCTMVLCLTVLLRRVSHHSFVPKILFEHLLSVKHVLMLRLLQPTRQALLGLVISGSREAVCEVTNTWCYSRECLSGTTEKKQIRRSWELSLMIHNIYVMVIYFIWEHFFNLGHARNTISVLKGFSWSVAHIHFGACREVPLERSVETPQACMSTAAFRRLEM